MTFGPFVEPGLHFRNFWALRCFNLRGKRPDLSILGVAWNHLGHIDGLLVVSNHVGEERFVLGVVPVHDPGD